METIKTTREDFFNKCGGFVSNNSTGQYLDIEYKFGTMYNNHRSEEKVYELKIVDEKLYEPFNQD